MIYFQLDRVNEEGITSMLQRVSTLSYGYEGRTEVATKKCYAVTELVSESLANSVKDKY